MTVKASEYGNGGEISLRTDESITVEGSLDVSGGCQFGEGGSILLSAKNAEIQDINALGGGSQSCE